MNTETKVCTKCKQEKPVGAFTATPGGYKSWCKECTNAASRERTRKRYHEDEAYRRSVLDKKAVRIQAERAAAAQERVKWLAAKENSAK